MLETRPLDLTARGLADCLGLLRATMPFADHFSTELLDWQYNANPAGRALGFNSYDGDKLVCHCVVQPLVARLFGQPARGVMSMNAATHPDYRGRGLYFPLAERCYELAREQGFDFGIAVTNDASTPGFVSRVGFQLVTPLIVKLGLGTPRKRTPAREVDLEKSWDKATLAWRLASPVAPYRRVVLGKRALLLAPARKAGIEVILAEIEAGMLEDCGEFRSTPAAGAVAATAGTRPTPTAPARAETARPSWNPIRLWAGLDPDIDWLRSAYLSLPLRLRPSPLNLIFKDLSGADRRLDPERVRWNALDFDDF